MNRRTHLPISPARLAARRDPAPPPPTSIRPDLKRGAAMTCGELVQLLSKLPPALPVELEDRTGRRRYAVDVVTSGAPQQRISNPARMAIR